MRKPRYLSPSSVATFYKDREEFYLRYLCETKTPRFPQTQPMSVGSSFDAFCKSWLHDRLFGNYGEDNEFEFQTIFEQQVEPQNRDWALKAGEHCFTVYTESGALADLLLDLERASQAPRFEFTVESRVAHESVVDGIPVLGKPDIYWYTAGPDGEDVLVIHDWKVNGYCSNYKKSPAKGYLRLRPGNKQHRNCQAGKVHGIEVNLAERLSSVDTGWADQLIAYSWVVCDDCPFVGAIEQLCCNPPNLGVGNPDIKVALLRFAIQQKEIQATKAKFATVWNTIESGHIFTDLSLEESMERCRQLDERARLQMEGTSQERWLADALRG